MTECKNLCTAGGGSVHIVHPQPLLGKFEIRENVRVARRQSVRPRVIEDRQPEFALAKPGVTQIVIHVRRLRLDLLVSRRRLGEFAGIVELVGCLEVIACCRK